MYIKYYVIIMYPICYNDYKAKRIGGANEADATQGEVGYRSWFIKMFVVKFLAFGQNYLIHFDS